MPIFRKKPIEIEARQWHPNNMPDLVAPVFIALDGKIVGENDGESTPRTPTNPGWGMKTLEGWFVVTDGDWIIKGIKGEMYPCKSDIFEATYEAVHE